MLNCKSSRYRILPLHGREEWYMTLIILLISAPFMYAGRSSHLFGQQKTHTNESTLEALKYFYKPSKIKVFVKLKSLQKSQSALSASFEYLCYGSTANINSFTLTVHGSTLDVR